MPYIGTSPTSAVRRIYTYTATAGQTTFSGASSEGSTLAYVDQNYIDVYLNGILLNSADYTATSGSSIVLGSGASVSDILTITVYDVFGVADTVSKKDGGTFDGNIAMGGTLSVTGNTTLSGDLSVSGALTGGGMDLLLTATWSSAVSQYDIPSGTITSTYDNYFIRWRVRPDTDLVSVNIRFEQGGSVDTGNNYAVETVNTLVNTSVSSNATSSISITTANCGSDVGEHTMGDMLLLDANSTTIPTSILGQYNQYNQVGSHTGGFFRGGQIQGVRTNAVTSLRFFPSSGNLTSGSISIYGLKQ